MFRVLFFILLFGFLSVVMTSICTISPDGLNALEVDVLATEGCHSSYACGYQCSCGLFQQFNLGTGSDPDMNLLNEKVCLGVHKGNSQVVDNTSRAALMQDALKGLPSTIRKKLVDTFYENPATRSAIKDYMAQYYFQLATNYKPGEPLLAGKVQWFSKPAAPASAASLSFDSDDEILEYDVSTMGDDEAEALFGGIGRFFRRAARSVGRFFRSAGRDVSHAARVVRRDVSHDFRSAARDVSHVARIVRRDVSHVVKDAWHGAKAAEKDVVHVAKDAWHGMKAVEKDIAHDASVVGKDIAHGADWVWNGVKWVEKDIAHGAEDVWHGMKVVGKDIAHGAEDVWNGKIAVGKDVEWLAKRVVHDAYLSERIEKALWRGIKIVTVGGIKGILWHGIKTFAKNMDEYAENIWPRLFTKKITKRALNMMITSSDINILVDLYTGNIDKFYLDYKNLCVLHVKNPDAVITNMETEMINKTNNRTEATIESILSRISARTSAQIVNSFQQELAGFRRTILNTFKALYNNENNLCSCQDMMNAAPKLGIKSSRVRSFQNIVANFCKEACDLQAKTWPRPTNVGNSGSSDNLYPSPSRS